MPLIRKLIDLQTSKAVTLPKSWLENAEQEAGKKIIAIALEVNRVITVSPIFEKPQTKEAIPNDHCIQRSENHS
jgi:hypothetical protein